MTTKPIAAAVLDEAQRLVEQHGGIRTAAKATGIPRGTLANRIKRAQERDDAPNQDDLIYPDLPSSELPAEQLIDQACKRFSAHLAARDAQRWFEIKVKSNQPIGIAMMGDPHVDSNGCNWPMLREHVRILENTPGMYAVNIGDLTDNWVGRLMRLYADQEMSKKQSWKVAKWLLRETKIKWLCHLLGNHDAWGDGPYLVKAAAQPIVPVLDWTARFQVAFPNGKRVRIHAAHDFPGNSIWNPQHGPQKAAMLQEQADIFVCGHKHQWHVSEGENANRDFVYWLVRTRGYKFIDSYADGLGYGSQRYGATITAVIDPSGDGPKRIRCIPDLAEAAEYLTWKRSR